MTDWTRVVGVVVIVLIILLVWRGFMYESYLRYGGVYFDVLFKYLGGKLHG